MNNSALIGMAQNATLLLSLAFVFNLIFVDGRTRTGWPWQLFFGALIGAIGCALMLTPWTLSEGLFFDLRVVLLSLSGLFFGPIPTVVAMAMTATLRWTQGGAFVTGISVILMAGTVGIAVRHLYRKPLDEMSLKALYGFGMLAPGAMLLLMFTLPLNQALKVLSVISLPVMVVYPLAALLLGSLLTGLLKRQRTLKELVAGEERLRLSLASARQGIYDLNLKTGEARVSPEYAIMLGYDPSGFRETHAAWLERLHPDDHQKAAQTLNDYLAGNLPEYRVEFRQRKRSGDWIWILSIGKLIERDPQGQPLRMVGTHTDISDQKLALEQVRTAIAETRRLLESSDQARLALLSVIEDSNESRARLEASNRKLLAEIEGRGKAEQNLGKSEARFRLLIDKSPAGMYVLRDNRFVYLNPRMEALIGRRLDEVAGMNPNAVLLADDTQTVKNTHTDITRRGEAAAFNARAEKPDGSVTELGIHELAVEFEGEPAVIGMAQDIGERNRAQAEINRYLHQLEASTEKTLQALSIMVEQRDPYTAGHERRVGDFAADIALEMGLPEKKVKAVRLAGYVHDIGKISVPAEILSKPRRLSDIEFLIIKEHPKTGYDIVKGIDFPWPLAEIVLQHHERLDGSGYPQGLKGESILPEARILAVADTIEAMTSHRPYRPGLGIEAALNEINRGAGKQYDPLVVDACVHLFRDKGYSLPA